MNNKIYNDITDFYNAVGEYLRLEYNRKIYDKYFNDENIEQNFDMVGKYYMGGNNIPDTARMIVDYFRMIK